MRICIMYRCNIKAHMCTCVCGYDEYVGICVYVYMRTWCSGVYKYIRTRVYDVLVCIRVYVHMCIYVYDVLMCACVYFIC